MLLDNLFVLAGAPTTAMMLLAILAFVGVPAVGAVACPSRLRQRLERR